MVNAPDDGVAVPESVGNELAVLPDVSKFKLFAPVVKTIVFPVDVRFANAGFAPVAPNNTWPLLPTVKELNVLLAFPTCTA